MQLQEYFDLSQNNTFGLPSRARYGGVITEAGQIPEYCALARRLDLPLYILGGGSNCLLPERLDAVVARMGIMGWSVDDSAGDAIRITANAGESWPDLVQQVTERGIGGLENLAGIPGTVGAAPIQNIGAYGVELEEVFESLKAYDRETGAPVTLDKAACNFSYRHSHFKDHPGRYIVTQVTLRLPRPWQPVLRYAGLDKLPEPHSPEAIMAEVLAQRGAKLPDWRLLGNTGSFFHNPVVSLDTWESLPEMPGHAHAGGMKLSAGWLIDQCGLKGTRIGGAGVHEGHALILVNHGKATLPEVQALADLVIRRVRDRFGVTLIQEPIAFS